MKQFSTDMTKLIQKNIIYKSPNSSTYTNFNPKFDHPYPKSLYKHKQSIYAQINKIKQQILQIKEQQQPDTIEEYRIKNIKLQEINKQYNRIQQQKRLLEEEMMKNKHILMEFKQSQLYRDIQKYQIQYEQIRKQIKGIDKQIMDIANQEIMIANYITYINTELINFSQNQRKKIQTQVDRDMMDQLRQQIKQINNQKKQHDLQTITMKNQIKRKIKELAQQNIQLQTTLRQATNQQLKRQLQQKKRNRKISKIQSTPILPKQQSVAKKKQIKQLNPQKQSVFPSLLLTQPTMITTKPRIKPKKHSQQTQTIKLPKTEAIVIGQWRQQNLINDDVIKQKNISRAVYMKVRTKQDKIIGMGITYVDSRGVQVLGRSNIWKLSENQLQQTQKQYNIDLQDVIKIQYYTQTIKTNITDLQTAKKNTNINSKIRSKIGLKFVIKQQQQQKYIKIGEFEDDKIVPIQNIINLQNKYIKTVQFTLGSDYQQISGIKIILANYGPPLFNDSQHQKIEQQIQNYHQRQLQMQIQRQRQKQDIFEIPENINQQIANKQDYHIMRPKQKQIGKQKKWVSVKSQGKLNTNRSIQKSINSMNQSNSAHTNNTNNSNTKLFVKHNTLIRKFGDVPEVDHRLLLNRKKKMV